MMIWYGGHPTCQIDKFLLAAPASDYSNPKRCTHLLRQPSAENKGFIMNKTPTLPLLRSRYQIFPPLPRDRRAALDESIVAHGVESPTTWDDQGNLLDGCERENICAAHGIRCPREVRC